ncbi:cupin domain-containing protein [Aureimonas altamirensis]|uniref:cupin domain-containing protein n=1 Tax=Aureimonas altamirensis TaxID=370622 RepID=UPI0025571320|nr:cupin domain-containing protein [Aureimonas altamirensis]
MSDLEVGGVTRPAGGEVRVLAPGEGESHWQPVPANGHIEILFAPGIVEMEHPIGIGTQTVPPGSYVREHAHDRNEEVLYFLRGKGRAVVEGQEYPLTPGTAIFIGKNRRHMFINDGEEVMHWVWLLVPNGLEDFFREIGRTRQAGEPTPVQFPRPENVLEIERRTVFAAQPADQRQP